VDIPIVFTGMRPGEKLYEELMTQEERVASATSHDKIFVARCAPFSSEKMEEVVAKLQEAALISDHEMIRKQLEGFVEGVQFNYEAPAIKAGASS
jgi:FlaA1/EpsC-like NDP-sugar epimerase